MNLEKFQIKTLTVLTILFFGLTPVRIAGADPAPMGMPQEQSAEKPATSAEETQAETSVPPPMQMPGNNDINGFDGSTLAPAEASESSPFPDGTTINVVDDGTTITTTVTLPDGTITVYERPSSSPSPSPATSPTSSPNPSPSSSPNPYLQDLDGDGENDDSLITIDSDEDGFEETFRIDYNFDGTIDAWGEYSEPPPSPGPNYLTDPDNGSYDYDGDGDNDGYGIDTDWDGRIDQTLIDSDGDGDIDLRIDWLDLDGDGVNDHFTFTWVPSLSPSPSPSPSSTPSPSPSSSPYPPSP